MLYFFIFEDYREYDFCFMRLQCTILHIPVVRAELAIIFQVMTRRTFKCQVVPPVGPIVKYQQTVTYACDADKKPAETLPRRLYGCILKCDKPVVTQISFWQLHNDYTVTSFICAPCESSSTGSLVLASSLLNYCERHIFPYLFPIIAYTLLSWIEQILRPIRSSFLRSK